MTLLIVSDANAATRFPARTDPVKLTISTWGCDAIASPTTGPYPVTMFSTPAGSPIAMQASASSIAFSGASSLGFSTTVQPAASAGATFAMI